MNNPSYKEIIKRQRERARFRQEPGQLEDFVDYDPSVAVANRAEYLACVESIRIADLEAERLNTIDRLRGEGFFAWIAARSGPRVGMYLHIRDSQASNAEQVRRCAHTYKNWLDQFLRRGDAQPNNRLDMLLVPLPSIEASDSHVLHLDMAVPKGWTAASLIDFCIKAWRFYNYAAIAEAEPITDSDPLWLKRMEKMALAPAYGTEWRRFCPRRAEADPLTCFFEDGPAQKGISLEGTNRS
jgi:hypothetical protein